MDELARAAGRLATALLCGMALSAAPAQAGVERARIVRVPCSGAALTNAVVTASGTTVLLRLAPYCVYNIADQLTVAGPTRITLIGGPATTIRHDPAAPGSRLFFVATVANIPGTLHIRNVFLLDGNPTSGDSGAILDTGNVVLDHVTMSGNTVTGSGGAMSVGATSSALIIDSVISGNRATGVGGGIDNFGSLTLVRSRLSLNGAATGGGIATDGPSAVTRVVQSTLDRNTATAAGGGTANVNNGRTLLERTRVTRNSAATGGGVSNAAGTSTTVRASIISGNTPDNCAPANSVPGCAG